MRKQIAAANWKMNLNLDEAKNLLNAFKQNNYSLSDKKQVIVAVPFPYLIIAKEILSNKSHFFIAAQNVSNKPEGAYTGEVSASMLKSMDIGFAIVGHSERREYYHESNEMIAEKIDQLLSNNIQPVFCCGEPLDVREAGKQNDHVSKQLESSLFHLSADAIQKIIIAYEPIWAIGTGKTAGKEQAQEMHKHIREQLAGKYGNEIAESISILYGGSVKGSNAAELFAENDVDGGLVGGASLKADEFSQIIEALKN